MIAPGPRILSVAQPWAWAIVAGHKGIENRSWSTPYRGTVYIHASKTFYRPGLEILRDEFDLEPPDDLPQGALAGVVELTRVITAEDDESDDPWFGGEYGWVLENPRVLGRPIPMLGSLGLNRAAPSIVEAVRRQLESQGGRSKIPRVSRRRAVEPKAEVPWPVRIKPSWK